MYSYIKGTLEEIGDGQIIVDNHGIGYQIQTPGNGMDGFLTLGETVKIYTYLHVKEDGIALFGFPTKDGLNLFRLLLKVNGIGPKGALGILSALTADDLRFAVIGGDAKAIAKAPGIGVKSAQRIILELKDKLDFNDILENQSKEGVTAFPSAANTVKNEAVQALTALGYSSSEALMALAKTEISDDADVESVLKAALKQMAFL